MQNPLPPDFGFCDHVFGSASVHEYVPFIRNGFFGSNVPVQSTFGAPPCPALPRAVAEADDVAFWTPTVPGGLPLPLFQWYVTIDVRQKDLPFVSKVGDLPPLSTPPAFELSKIFTVLPVQVALGRAPDETAHARARQRAEATASTRTSPSMSAESGRDNPRRVRSLHDHRGDDRRPRPRRGPGRRAGRRRRLGRPPGGAGGDP